jgi:hypothetical protein
MITSIVFFLGFGILLIGGLMYPGTGGLLPEHRVKRTPMTAYWRTSLWNEDGKRKITRAFRVQLVGLALIGLAMFLGQS